VTDAWKYLTPFQRKVIRLRAKLFIARKNITLFWKHLYFAPIRILRKMELRSYPAHWI
jgi:hypothetical protein